ncbi:hypothetical protein [Halobiforma nitratireducens]|uniref:CbaC protein n=1 Tax=Halobiforma nitratireducens JCM 10879 TaxID=1227454 RepID=M0LIQ7_9EURY|nr:hypothetical protein [Halobiforma nitratireducens]EMA31890.1 CbaC protein [Halobiforma nitratireducens JCM 10879]
MRISKGALLVVLAFTVPVVVELRTVLSWIDVQLTVLETVLVGAAMVLAILVWALWPVDEDGDGDGNDGVELESS